MRHWKTFIFCFVVIVLSLIIYKLLEHANAIITQLYTFSKKKKKTNSRRCRKSRMCVVELSNLNHKKDVACVGACGLKQKLWLYSSFFQRKIIKEKICEMDHDCTWQRIIKTKASLWPQNLTNEETERVQYPTSFTFWSHKI